VARESFEHPTATGLDEPAAGARRRSPMTGALVIGATAVLVALPACSSSPAPGSTPTSTSHTTTSTSAPPSTALPQVSSAQVAACQADARTLESALGAYNALKGAYPSPPTMWSAATYATNFQALTSTAVGGPYLPNPPPTKFFVIEFDSSGHVWVAPPGSYSASYNQGQSFDANPDICIAAVG